VLLRKGYPTGLGATILVLGISMDVIGSFLAVSVSIYWGISEAIPQKELKECSGW
jgi:hypothetical protein